MKVYFRYIIVLALITVLCTGIVSAAISGTATEDNRVNKTMQPRSSLVSASSEKDQVTLADIKATLPPEIQQSINEQIAFNDNVTKAISEKEEHLVQSPLIINDTYDITGEAQGFFVGDITTSLEPASNKSEFIQQDISSSATILPVNQIPNGGFIAFASDGKTRIFTSEGTQISYAVDEKSEKVTTPSGKVLPSTHVIGIPNGAASHSRGNTEYITMKGEVILTIIDHSSEEILGNRIVPSALSYPWVEYAESDSYYIAAVHSNWGIPHSPNLGINATNANILFNGVEPSDGSIIFQPVTAFNYYEHSLTGNHTDPAIVNRWTGSSWICPQDNNHCTHSYPVLSFSQGDLAYGGIFWYEAPVLKWLVYLVNGTNQGTWLYSDRYIYSQPSRAVIAYEFGGSAFLGESPLDREKITSTTFSNISVWDTIGNQISSLHWNGVVNTKDHKRTTGLNVDLSQAPSTVILNTSDYRTTVGVYRNGVFYLRNSNTNGPADLTFAFGQSGDKPVVGNWDGIGAETIGVYRNGVFYLRNSNTNGPADLTFAFGQSGDKPVTGDWNRDATDTIGVFRNGTFFLRNSNTNGAPDLTFIFGQTGDVPVIGDWNGDGTDTIGVFRNGTFYLRNSNTNGVPDLTFIFGQAGDVPVIGDWNGDGTDTIGVFRNGTFFLRNSNTNGAPDLTFIFGQPGDVPVVGDWI